MPADGTITQKRMIHVGNPGGGGSQARTLMTKAAAATVAIRSIKVKRCLDGVMLSLRGRHRPGRCGSGS
jgi:hypothetical protein